MSETTPPVVPYEDIPTRVTTAGGDAGFAAPQSVIGGYPVVRVLGRGGMGLVYLARDVALDRLVAVKVLLEGNLASASLLSRFQLEAQAVARIQHSNVAQIYEVGSDEGRPFLVMEYLAGGTLSDRVRQGPLAPNEGAAIVETLARGMQAAHDKGIVHRDLKPSNVLLSETGTLKITDFGLAKRLDSVEQATQTGDILGTPNYMAPEQAGGVVKNVGPSCDIYALGAVLYELLSGHPPFEAPDAVQTVLLVLTAEPVSIRRLQPRIPVDLSTICHKCLEKSPKRRYATAADLAEDLARFRQGLPITARPLRAWEKGVRWARRRPAAAGLIGVSTVGLAALLIGGAWYNARLQDSNRRLTEELARSHRLVSEGDGLAQWVLQDHLNEISRLRGASPARKQVVERLKTYLTGLAADADGRDPLVRTIARSWLRLAEIQGDSDSFNLGNPEEALASCEQALALYERAVAAEPDDAELRAGLLYGRRTAIQMRSALGKPQDERAQLQQLLTDIQNLKFLGKIEPDRVQALECLARADLGWCDRMQGRLADAVREFSAALATAETLARPGPRQAAHESTVALLRSHLAQTLQDVGEYDAALVHSRKLVEYGAREVKKSPTDARRLRAHALHLKTLGDVLTYLHRSEESSAAYQAAEAILRSLLSDDPENALVRSDLVGLLDRLATAADLQKDFAGAKARVDEAVSLHARLLERQPGHAGYRRTAWLLENGRGKYLRLLGNTGQAIKALEGALEIEKQLLAEDPTRTADRQGMAETYSGLASAYIDRGIAQMDDADFDRAVDQFRRSLATFDEIEGRGPLGPDARAIRDGVRKNLAALEEMIKKLKGLAPASPPVTGRQDARNLV